MITYILRVGEGKEDISETKGMVTYILRFGEGDKDISETRGASKAWSRTF
jgi:hypothetical protein